MALFTIRPSVRILLLTSHGVRMYVGEQGQLILQETFAVGEQGLAAFDHCLSSLSDCPVHLVVDLSEEDFRVETVAHVVGNDRKILLERKLLQYFRGSEYRLARVQDRETVGRRDDRVLFSALTRPELLTPWIDCLLKRKIRIKGIVSVPLLMELFAEFMQQNTLPHLLLVNLEEGVGLRQTYLQQGRLKFSRLLSITGQDAVAEKLLAECRNIRQYLERLKLLPYDQPLQVHVCAAEGVIEELAVQPMAAPLLQLHFKETRLLGAELGIDPATLQDHGVVYLCLLRALQAKKLCNAYAAPSVTRYHRLWKIRQGLIVMSTLLLAVILLAGALLVGEGFTAMQERQRLDREMVQIQARLDDVRRAFPETPIPAREMRNLVDSVERIRAQEILPMQTMALVSRVIMLFPNVRIKGFDWRLSPLAGTEQEGVATPTESGEGLGGRAPVPKILPRLLEGNTIAVSLVSGMVIPSGGYGKAQQVIKQLIVALEKIPGMKVTPIAMPTDTKPNATVKANLNDADILAEFSLKLEHQGGQ